MFKKQYIALCTLPLLLFELGQAHTPTAPRCVMMGEYTLYRQPLPPEQWTCLFIGLIEPKVERSSEVNPWLETAFPSCIISGREILAHDPSAYLEASGTCVSVKHYLERPQDLMAFFARAPRLRKPIDTLKPDTAKPLIMAHYMPWFETPEVRGTWGLHWAMDTCNPDALRDDGLRDICAEHYPLIGPYDSTDPDLLEYHILLMKLTGIDGIIIDWYGVLDAYDWGILREATEVIVKAFNEAGLKVAIMFEDKTLDVALKHELIEDPLELGRAAFRYLAKEMFPLEHYLHMGGKPVVMTYGPLFYDKEEQWQAFLADVNEPVHLIGFREIPNISTGSYAWVFEDPEYIPWFYRTAKNSDWELTVGGAYPMFADYYGKGGWGESLFELDTRYGERFNTLFRLATMHQVDIVQLITWNDFGEGTEIEPTVEYGYAYLRDIQTYTQTPYTLEDLQLPAEIYALRKRLNGAEAHQVLDNAVMALLAGDYAQAEAHRQVAELGGVQDVFAKGRIER